MGPKRCSGAAEEGQDDAVEEYWEAVVVKSCLVWVESVLGQRGWECK